MLRGICTRTTVAVHVSSASLYLKVQSEHPLLNIDSSEKTFKRYSSCTSDPYSRRNYTHHKSQDIPSSIRQKDLVVLLR